MQILLVGGTGVLSSAVAKAAVESGMAVSIITRGNREPALGLESIICDCRDYERLGELLSGRFFDVVIDFLSFNPFQIEKSFEFYSKITKQFVFISSAFVYDFTQGGGCAEDSPRRLKSWSYSIGKADAEDRLLEMSKDYSCPITVVRPMVTYGDTRIPYGLSPRHGYDWTFVERIKAKKPIITWNSGNNRCNIMRVEDFAIGLLGLFGNPRAYGESFNVSGDEAPRWKDVLDAVEKFVNVKIDPVDVPVDVIAQLYPEKREEIQGRAVDAVVSNAKIKSIIPTFGRAAIGLEEGVAKTLKSYEGSVGLKSGIDWRYDGFCDRVLNKMGREGGRKLSFVDYLGTATFKDRVEYWMAAHDGEYKMRVFRKLLGAWRRIKMVTKRLTGEKGYD